MHISELLVENEQLDELSLKGIGQGIGKVAGALGRGVGNIQGAWQGAKDAYTQNRDRINPVAQRNVSRAGNATAQPAATAQPVAPAQTVPADNSQVAGGEIASNNLLARAKQGTAQDPNLQPAPTQEPVAQPAPTQPAPVQEPVAQPAPTEPATVQDPAATTKPGKVGVPAGKKAVDQAVATVKTVRSDRRPQVVAYGKQQFDALAAPAAVPNQAEIDADRERLMGPDNGGANESRVIKFRSKFLGMDI
jgi:hypothetical protein